MKRIFTPLLLLLAAACADVAGPPEQPSATPAAPSETDIILKAAMADELYASGRMNTVGVLSEGRTADAAVVYFSNPTQALRYQFRRIDGRWTRAEGIGPQLGAAPAGGPRFATAYAARIAEVFKLPNTFYQNINVNVASASSGTFVSSSAQDAAQSLSRVVFYPGTQTTNDTIFAVSLLSITYWRTLPNNGFANGSCNASPCVTVFTINGVDHGSQQVSVNYHLKVTPPVTISPISGVDTIAWQGHVTWTAQASGGDSQDPAAVYDWEISYDNATWSDVGTGSASYTRVFNTTSHASFWLRVRATRSGRTSPYSAAKRVGVNSYLNPQLLAGEIDGVNVVTTQNTHYWTVYPTGGTGTYSYQWYVIWDGAPYHTDGPLGTGQSQSMSVIPEDGNFSLRVVVTSGGQTSDDYIYVTNLMTCGDDFCEVDP